MNLREKFRFVKSIMDEEELSLELKLKLTKYTKQEIRRTLKSLEKDPFDPVYHYEDEYGDYFYIKEFFDIPFTGEDKKEFIDSQWRRIHSPYDCTGGNIF